MFCNITNNIKLTCVYCLFEPLVVFLIWMKTPAKCTKCKCKTRCCCIHHSFIHNSVPKQVLEGNVQESLLTNDLSLHTRIIICEWHVDLTKEQQEGEIKIARGGIRRKKRGPTLSWPLLASKTAAEALEQRSPA